MADIEKVEWVQLDKQKFNLVVIRLPEHFMSYEVSHAHELAQQLRESGVQQVIIMAPGWDIQFAEQEPQQKAEGE